MALVGKGNEQVIISLTDECLKFALTAKSGGERKLLNVTKVDFSDSSREELVKGVQASMDSLGVKKARGICVISSSLTTTKNIEIPSIDPEEIESIIDLQAGRHTPYSREEILIGYIKIGVHSRNYTKVLLIIINREIIKKHLDVCEECGIKIDKVIFAPEAKATFYGKILNVKEDDKPIGIIDIAKHSTDFNVQGGGTVIACRNIPIGMDALLKEGEETKAKLIAEITQSIESYQSEDISVMPETYLLTSDDAKIKELQPILMEKIKANVKVNPFLDHVVTDQQVMLKIVSEYDDESFMDVLAPVSVQEKMAVDLLPEEVQTQRAIEEQGRQVVLAGTLGLILLVLFVSMFFMKLHFRSQYLEKLTQVYREKRIAVLELEQIANNTQIVKGFILSRMISLDVIDEIYAIVPNEIYFKNIVLEENGSIHIQGVSETRSTAFAFITILEDSQFFKSAKMISSSAKKERGKDVSVFEISFKLESAKDEEEPPPEEAAPEEEAPPEDEG